jgi:integrase/GTPase SAR1 family protein
MQVWDEDLTELDDASESASEQQVQYTNAKVLLVGDSGVGKSGLSRYLAHGVMVEDDKPIPSTDGAWATHWLLPDTAETQSAYREIWLWDFAGQVDYRLVHQLFMDDTAAAVLVFNPQDENPFEGLGQWDHDLRKATRTDFAKLLVAGRIDRGGLIVSDASMARFVEERGFVGQVHKTSAKTGQGCDALRVAIAQTIDWQTIPVTTSPALYHRLKQEILRLRDSGVVLIRLGELKQRMEMTLLGEEFALNELETVISLLAGPGMIQRLDFGGFILLRPEVLSRYAAALVRQVRQHPQELGCISEEDLLAGKLDYQDFDRLSRDDEIVVLRTLCETCVSRAWCLRQTGDGPTQLTFPSYFRRERPHQTLHPAVQVTYRFSGPADDVYATLVVRLHHTVAFQTDQLWRAAADFKTQLGARLGLKLTREAEGTSRLDVYFEPDVDENSRVLFLRYVHEHLHQNARNVERLRHYSCTNKKCRTPFSDRARIDEALAPGGSGKVFCPKCGKPIVLRDAMEKRFDSPEVKADAHEQAARSQFVIDSESRELILVGHAYSIAREAGQIYRGYTKSDHGIDGEIEFKNSDGNASGKRLYLQLKSGDSYVSTRQRDASEVFQIKNAQLSSARALNRDFTAEETRFPFRYTLEYFLRRVVGLLGLVRYGADQPHSWHTLRTCTMLKTKDTPTYTGEQAAAYKAANIDFPLWWHPRGGWTKKIRGSCNYFGRVHPDVALARYHADRDYLERGEIPPPYDPAAVTIRDLCNEFLASRKQRVESGELTPESWREYHRNCDRIVKHLGRHRRVANLAAADFTSLRAALAKGRGLLSLGGEVNRARSLFKFAYDAGLIERPVRYGSNFSTPSAGAVRRARYAAGRQDFTPAEVRKLLAAASGQTRAMVLLGVSCGLGNTDCGKLRIEMLDLDGGWLDYPRPKTGTRRRARLWPEAIKALRACIGERTEGPVFRTSQYNAWGHDDVSRAFRKVLSTVGLAKTGRGFYGLRKTFRTIAAETGDEKACDLVMGHVDTSMGGLYTQRIGDDRLRRIGEHVRAVVLGALTE